MSVPIHHRGRRALLVTTALVGGLLAVPVRAELPSNYQVLAGAAPTVKVDGGVLAAGAASGSGNALTVDLNDAATVLSWDTFNVSDVARSVAFNHGTATGSIAVLNRVLGGASSISGPISSESGVAVWLVNGAGITFNAGGSFSGGSLILSTADFLTDGAFTGAAGTYVLKGATTAPITLSGSGTIAAAQGFAAVGQSVTVGKAVSVSGGNVALVAAKDVTLGFTTGSPFTIQLDKGTTLATAQLTTSGAISANSIRLAAASQSGSVAALLNVASGSLTATSGGGRVVLATAASSADGVTFAASGSGGPAGSGGIAVAGLLDASAGGGVSVASSGAAAVTGTVTAGGDYSVTGTSVSLGGIQSAGKAVSITATDGAGTGITSSGLYQLTSNSAVGEGEGAPTGQLRLDSAAAIDLTGATLTAGPSITPVTPPDSSYISDILVGTGAGSDLKLGLVRAGTLKGLTGSVVGTTGAITVGDVYTTNAVDLRGSSITAGSFHVGTSPFPQPGHSIALTASVGDVTVTDTIQATGDITVKTPTAETAGLTATAKLSKAAAGGDLTVTAGSVQLASFANAVGAVSITATDPLTAGTGITGSAGLVLTVNRDHVAPVPMTLSSAKGIDLTGTTINAGPSSTSPPPPPLSYFSAVRVGVNVGAAPGASEALKLGTVNAAALTGLGGGLLTTTGAVTIADANITAPLTLTAKSIDVASSGALTTGPLVADDSVTLTAGGTATIGAVSAGTTYAATGGTVVLGGAQSAGRGIVISGAGGISADAGTTLTSNRSGAVAPGLQAGAIQLKSSGTITLSGATLKAGDMAQSDVLVGAGGDLTLGQVTSAALAGLDALGAPTAQLLRTGTIGLGGATLSRSLDVKGKAVDVTGAIAVGDVGKAIHLTSTTGGVTATANLGASGNVITEAATTSTTADVDAGNQFIATGQSVVLSGTEVAGGPITITATAPGGAGISSTGTVALTSTNGSVVTLDSAAAIKLAGSITLANPAGDLRVGVGTGASDTLTLGQVSAHGLFGLGGPQVATAADVTIGGATLVASLDVKTPALLTVGAMTVSGGSETLQGGALRYLGSQTIAAGLTGIATAGDITTGGASITLAADTNGAALGNLSLTALTPTTGSIVVPNATLIAGTAANRSDVNVATRGALTLGDVTARALHVTYTPPITAGPIVLKRVTVDTALDLTGTSITTNGPITVAGTAQNLSLTSTVGNVTAAGKLQATGTITVRTPTAETGGLTSTASIGDVSAGVDYTVTGGSVSLSGVQAAEGAIKITATDALLSGTGISGTPGLVLNSDRLGITGGTMSLTSAKAIDLTGSTLSAGPMPIGNFSAEFFATITAQVAAGAALTLGDVVAAKLAVPLTTGGAFTLGSAVLYDTLDVTAASIKTGSIRVSAPTFGSPSRSILLTATGPIAGDPSSIGTITTTGLLASTADIGLKQANGDLAITGTSFAPVRDLMLEATTGNVTAAGPLGTLAVPVGRDVIVKAGATKTATLTDITAGRNIAIDGGAARLSGTETAQGSIVVKATDAAGTGIIGDAGLTLASNASRLTDAGDTLGVVLSSASGLTLDRASSAIDAGGGLSRVSVTLADSTAGSPKTLTLGSVRAKTLFTAASAVTDPSQSTLARTGAISIRTLDIDDDIVVDTRGTGALTIDQATSRTGGINLLTTGALSANSITANGYGVVLTGATIAVDGAVMATTVADLYGSTSVTTTGPITTAGGDLRVTTIVGDITIPGVVAQGPSNAAPQYLKVSAIPLSASAKPSSANTSAGNVIMSAGRNIVLGSATSKTAAIDLTAGGSAYRTLPAALIDSLRVKSLTAGTATLTATAGDVRVGSATTTAGDLRLDATAGSVTGLATADTLATNGTDLTAKTSITAKAATRIALGTANAGTAVLLAGLAPATPAISAVLVKAGTNADVQAGAALSIDTVQADGAAMLSTASGTATSTTGLLTSLSDTLTSGFGFAALTAAAAGASVRVNAPAGLVQLGDVLAGCTAFASCVVGADTASTGITVKASAASVQRAFAATGSIDLTALNGGLYLGTGAAAGSLSLTKADGDGDGLLASALDRDELRAGTLRAVKLVRVRSATDARLTSATSTGSGSDAGIDVAAMRALTGATAPTVPVTGLRIATLIDSGATTIRADTGDVRLGSITTAGGDLGITATLGSVTGLASADVAAGPGSTLTSQTFVKATAGTRTALGVVDAQTAIDIGSATAIVSVGSATTRTTLAIAAGSALSLDSGSAAGATLTTASGAARPYATTLTSADAVLDSGYGAATLLASKSGAALGVTAGGIAQLGDVTAGCTVVTCALGSALPGSGITVSAAALTVARATAATGVLALTAARGGLYIGSGRAAGIATLTKTDGDGDGLTFAQVGPRRTARRYSFCDRRRQDPQCDRRAAEHVDLDRRFDRCSGDSRSDSPVGGSFDACAGPAGFFVDGRRRDHDHRRHRRCPHRHRDHQRGRSDRDGHAWLGHRPRHRRREQRAGYRHDRRHLREGDRRQPDRAGDDQGIGWRGHSGRHAGVDRHRDGDRPAHGQRGQRAVARQRHLHGGRDPGNEHWRCRGGRADLDDRYVSPRVWRGNAHRLGTVGLGLGVGTARHRPARRGHGRCQRHRQGRRVGDRRHDRAQRCARSHCQHGWIVSRHRQRRHDRDRREEQQRHRRAARRRRTARDDAGRGHRSWRDRQQQRDLDDASPAEIGARARQHALGQRDRCAHRIEGGDAGRDRYRLWPR